LTLSPEVIGGTICEPGIDGSTGSLAAEGADASAATLM
jgi:hypothetical protein